MNDDPEIVHPAVEELVRNLSASLVTESLSAMREYSGTLGHFSLAAFAAHSFVWATLTGAPKPAVSWLEFGWLAIPLGLFTAALVFSVVARTRSVVRLRPADAKAVIDVYESRLSKMRANTQHAALCLVAGVVGAYIATSIALLA
jgi:hypothetical protein